MSQPADVPTPRRPLDKVPAINVALPRGWITRGGRGPDVVLVARPRLVGLVHDDTHVPPEVVLRIAEVDESLLAWRTEAMQSLADQLDGFDLEDTDDYVLAGHPVRYQRFGHRVGDTEVLAEQWAWRVAGLGITLTGSVARAAWGEYCTVFEDIAATLEIRGDLPR